MTIFTWLVPLLLFFSFFIPFLVSYIIRKRYKNIFACVVAVLLSTFLMSGVSLSALMLDKMALEQEIAPLDRDGDGMYSPQEEANWTDRERKSMQRFIGDGGRNVFAVFFLPVFSFVCASIFICIYWLATNFLERKHQTAA